MVYGSLAGVSSVLGWQYGIVVVRRSLRKGVLVSRKRHCEA
jgi:hypothetical protein